MFALLSLSLCLLPLRADDAETPKLPRNVLTNQGVLTLAEAGYDEDFLIDLIRSRPTRFDVGVEALAALAQRGLSEGVVRAMLARPNGQGEAHPRAPAPAAPPTPTMVPVRLAPAVRMLPPGFAARPAAGLPSCQIISRRTWLLRRKWYVVQPQPENPAPRYLPVW